MRSPHPQVWPAHKQPSQSRLERPQPGRLHKALLRREHHPQELLQPEHRRPALRVKPDFSRNECGHIFLPCCVGVRAERIALYVWHGFSRAIQKPMGEG